MICWLSEMWYQGYNGMIDSLFNQMITIPMPIDGINDPRTCLIAVSVMVCAQK